MGFAREEFEILATSSILKLFDICIVNFEAKLI